MKFSQRMGYRKVREVIQYESLDKATKNSLWNIVCKHFFANVNVYSSTTLDSFLYNLWHNFYKLPVDTISNDYIRMKNIIKDNFFNGEWYDIFDFLELAPLYYYDNTLSQDIYRKECNEILVRECSAYRFVDEYIVEITSEIEINSIEEALELSDVYKGVKEHLNTSLQLLSDRSNPDYRNSIKESISAIEAMCVIIANDNKATLGKALDIMDSKKKIHGALKETFKKLYGYTSDENGIRHAMIEHPNIDYKEAIYILVCCSAFINYLKEYNGKMS